MQSLSQPMKAMRRYRLRYLLLLLLFYVWILIRLHTKTFEQSESTYHNLYRLYNDYNIIICLAFIGHGRDGNVSHHTSIWSKISALPLLSVNNSICLLYIIKSWKHDMLNINHHYIIIELPVSRLQVLCMADSNE